MSNAIATYKILTLSKHISRGNTKVPYYVFNMNSATDCPSKKLGLCKHAKICYARKSEYLYPQVLPYRRRQAEYWKNTSANAFVGELVSIQGRARKMPKVLRFSESGDFENQVDVDKFTRIAWMLKGQGWKVYGYTARIDLDLSKLIKHASVNLSGDCKAIIKKTNRFKVVKKPSGDNFVCIGDCKKCNLCISATGKTIEVIKH